MRRLLLAMFMLVALVATSISINAQQVSARWQQRVDCNIQVKLDDSTRSLDGHIQINYINHSPDTLRFIWFHLWPNAYKNDRTAFSEQLLKNGRTEFYFSTPEDRGYINKLNFSANGINLDLEDHSQFIDAVRLILAQPLLPSDSVMIETPFHVKLPKLFSRSGYNGRGYAVTQWYPKPAVYDQEGWHVMPYLDQGEFHAEFGKYNVSIEVPDSFVVAATGQLLNDDERARLIAGMRPAEKSLTLQGAEKKMNSAGRKQVPQKKPVARPLQPVQWKTLRYEQDSVHDFAWFTSKYFVVDHDTVQLVSGRAVDVFSYYYPEYAATWKPAVGYSADAIRFRSASLFEYPYGTVSVVQSLKHSSEGMEYPMVTFISGAEGETLDFLIEHEIGHNWFQGIIASDERKYPWMDEGMNSFFGQRYMLHKYGRSLSPYDGLNSKSRMVRKLPEDPEAWLLQTIESLHASQPVNTPSDQLTSVNYGIIPYLKTSAWLQSLERKMGAGSFEKGMKAYLQQSKFAHPSPSDFQQAMESAANTNLGKEFSALDNPTAYHPGKRVIKPTLGFNFNNTSKVQYINFLPVPAYNRYDKFMIGIAVHNYNLPVSRFQFIAVPLYATGSRKLNYLAHADYTWRSSRWDEKFVASLDLQSFSRNVAFDSLGAKQFETYRKIAPSLTYQFHSTAGSSFQRYIRLKTYLLREQDFRSFGFAQDDSLFTKPFVRNIGSSDFYINELSFVIAQNRVLYPNDWLLQWQQGNGFMRFNATGNYFFNYKKYGGLSIRFFASKFMYIGSKNRNNPALQRFQPKLLGSTGEEDYTYSNYFFGRTASYANAGTQLPNRGFAAQQIMVRDGGFKMRLDYFDFLQGRSDDWVTGINLNSNLPANIFAVKLPLKVFFDIGTASGNWSSGYAGARFLYVGGLQLSLFKSIVNVYAPIVYSKDIRDNLKSVPELNSFAKRITFSIDIQRISLRRFSFNQIPF